MVQAEVAFVARAIRRIYRAMLVLAVLGTVVAGVGKGWAASAGFALGAAAAYLNFRWLHQLAEAIGPEGRRPPRRLALWLSLRYLLFGAGAYVIVKYFEVSPLALLAGFLVPVASVIAEILYELTYARA